MDKSKLPKKSRIRKTPETVRERADKGATKKVGRTRKLKGKIHRPLSVLRRVGQKEFNPVPIPDNKAGRILGKRVRIVPKFFRESWAELKLVTWPTKKVALKLVGAVIIFAIIFSIFVQVLDLIFSQLIKEILQ